MRCDAIAYLAQSVATRAIAIAIAIEVVPKTHLKATRRELFSVIGVFEPVAQGAHLISQADDLL